MLSDAFHTRLGAGFGPIVAIMTDAAQLMLTSVRKRKLMARSLVGAARPDSVRTCSGVAPHQRTIDYERAANTLVPRQLDGCRVLRRHRLLGGLFRPWASRRGAGALLRLDAHKGLTNNPRLVSPLAERRCAKVPCHSHWKPSERTRICFQG